MTTPAKTNKSKKHSTEVLQHDKSSPKRAKRTEKRSEGTSPKTPKQIKKTNDTTPPDSPSSPAEDDDVRFVEEFSSPFAPKVAIKEEPLEDNISYDDWEAKRQESRITHAWLCKYPFLRNLWHSENDPSWLLSSSARMRRACDDLSTHRKIHGSLNDMDLPIYLLEDELIELPTLFPELGEKCTRRIKEVWLHEKNELRIAAEDCRERYENSLSALPTPVATLPTPTCAATAALPKTFFTASPSVANVAAAAGTMPFVANLTPISSPGSFARGVNSLQTKIDEIGAALAKLNSFDIPDAEVPLIQAHQMTQLRVNFLTICAVMRDENIALSYDHAHSEGDWDAILVLVQSARITLNNMLLSLTQHGSAPTAMATQAQIKYLTQLNYDPNIPGNKKYEELTSKAAGTLITGLKASKKMAQEIGK